MADLAVDPEADLVAELADPGAASVEGAEVAAETVAEVAADQEEVDPVAASAVGLAAARPVTSTESIPRSSPRLS